MNEQDDELEYLQERLIMAAEDLLNYSEGRKFDSIIVPIPDTEPQLWVAIGEMHEAKKLI